MAEVGCFAVLQLEVWKRSRIVSAIRAGVARCAGKHGASWHRGSTHRVEVAPGGCRSNDGERNLPSCGKAEATLRDPADSAVVS